MICALYWFIVLIHACGTVGLIVPTPTPWFFRLRMMSLPPGHLPDFAQPDRRLDADVGLLRRAREDLRRDVVLVDVDADAPLAELRRLLERAVTAEACDLEDDLGPWRDLVLRRRLRTRSRR